MVSVLDDLGTYLAAAPAVFSSGQLTKGRRPESPDLVGTLYEYPGEEGVQKFGGVGLQFIKPRVHLEVRGSIRDYVSARTLIQSAIDKIHQITPATTMASGWKYLIAVAVTPAYGMGRDKKDRPIVAVNFRFEIEL